MANSSLAFRSSLNLRSIRKSLSGLGESVRTAQSSASSITTSIRESNRNKKKSLSLSSTLFRRRREATLRKEREDILEAGSVSGSVKRAGKVVMNSTKGFLGRILDYLGTVLIGWAINNLPKIIDLAEKLIKRMQKYFSILSDFTGGVFQILTGFGELIGGVATSIATFNFGNIKSVFDSSIAKMQTGFNRMLTNTVKSLNMLTDDASTMLRKMGFNIADFEIPELKLEPEPDITDPGAPEPAAPEPSTSSSTQTGPGSGQNLGVGAGAVRKYASQKGYSPEFTAGLLSTIENESGFRPYAVGDGGASYGLFQFNDGAGRRQPFLNFLSASGIPNPKQLFLKPNSQEAQKYKNKVLSLTLEYMMEREQGAQIVRDLGTSKNLRVIMGGFEDIERYAGSQPNLLRNNRNNPKYNDRLKDAQRYLGFINNNPSPLFSPQSQPPQPQPQTQQNKPAGSFAEQLINIFKPAPKQSSNILDSKNATARGKNKVVVVTVNGSGGGTSRPVSNTGGGGGMMIASGSGVNRTWDKMQFTALS